MLAVESPAELCINNIICTHAVVASQNGRPRRAVRKAGNLGGSRMMECEIGYPHGRYVEHIITWRKQGDEVRRSVVYNRNSFALSLQRDLQPLFQLRGRNTA